MTLMQHHRINTYYNSLDKLLAELGSLFESNNQDVLCALGAVVLGEASTHSDYELVGNFYILDNDLIEADRLFDHFKYTNDDSKVSSFETASEVIHTLCKNELLEMDLEFVKVAKILAVIPATSCSAERSFSELRRLKTYYGGEEAL